MKRKATGRFQMFQVSFLVILGGIRVTDKPTREDILQVLAFLVPVIDDSKGESSNEVAIKLKSLRWHIAGWFLN